MYKVYCHCFIALYGLDGKIDRESDRLLHLQDCTDVDDVNRKLEDGVDCKSLPGSDESRKVLTSRITTGQGALRATGKAARRTQKVSQLARLAINMTRT